MALVNVFSDLERVTFLKREPRVWKSALLRPFASFPVSARAVPVQGGAPYFFGVLLQTQRLAQFRPLGHAEIPFGSPKESHWATQQIGWVTQASRTSVASPAKGVCFSDHGDHARFQRSRRSATPLPLPPFITIHHNPSRPHQYSITVVMATSSRS
jgi:hypothetical protein